MPISLRPSFVRYLSQVLTKEPTRIKVWFGNFSFVPFFLFGGEMNVDDITGEDLEKLLEGS